MTAIHLPAPAPAGTEAGGGVALGATGVLRSFNDAGVLAPADIHVARRLDALAGDGHQAALLAVAFAVRAPRLGHVCVDLARVRWSATSDTVSPAEVQALPWPDPVAWVEAAAASPAVAAGAGGPDDRPLRLDGSRLYLDRYWRQERKVAADLRARGAEAAGGVDTAVLAAGLDRLFPPAAGAGAGPDLQRLAAATAVLRRLAVVAGGPGTGKTTTVAAILALLDEQAAAAGARPPRVALAAPTGKAAARLEEAVHQEAARLDVSDATRSRLLALEGSTLHRLLGWRPAGRTRFRHHRGNRLPHDAVVVDETSMVSLSMLANLVDAVGAGARLVLVGDPDQLASVEAGAVLGDIVGPAAGGLRMRLPAKKALAAAGAEVIATDPPAGAAVADGIVVLRRVHRYAGRLADLADSIHRADGPAAVEVLTAGGSEVRWLDVDVAGAGDAALTPVREAVVAAGQRVWTAANAGDGRAALDALGAFRLLCAHRRGPAGAAEWTGAVERWLRQAEPDYSRGAGRWYAGQPLLVTENDYALRLFNGDTGVVVARGERLSAVFERRGQLLEVSPARLQAVETVHAMTVHKSQGSQFGVVAVLLPEPESPLLTRELLYTAVTRAQSTLVVAGSEASVRAAIDRPVGRASGLEGLLWSE